MYFILLSILSVRDRKDNTEGPKPARVLSQTHRKPNQQTGHNYRTEKIQCHLWGSNLWLPKYMSGALKPHSKGFWSEASGYLICIRAARGSKYMLYLFILSITHHRADLDFNKGGASMRRAVQWRSHCHGCFAAVGWVWEGEPLPREVQKLHGAIRLFYDTRNTVRCNNY